MATNNLKTPPQITAVAYILVKTVTIINLPATLPQLFLHYKTNKLLECALGECYCRADVPAK